MSTPTSGNHDLDIAKVTQRAQDIENKLPRLNPVDVLPDVVVGAGYLDDATVVAFCLKLVEKELEQYQQWLATRTKGSGPVVDV